MRNKPSYLVLEEECSGKMHALVAGSFDPVTKGHMDIISRAAKMFQKVTVCAFVNPDKEYLLSLDEKRELLSAACKDLANVTVASDSGMLYAFCNAHGIDLIVKGVRNNEDAAVEYAAAAFNYEHGGVKTLLLEADPDLLSVSSSLVKDRLIEGKSISELLPKGVEKPFLNMLLQRL